MRNVFATSCKGFFFYSEGEIFGKNTVFLHGDPALPFGEKGSSERKKPLAPAMSRDLCKRFRNVLQGLFLLL